MEHFWEYLAYVANALIFLLVGLQIDLISLWQSLDLILLVSVSMLFSRALVIFIGLPVIGKIPGSVPIGTPFKLVMYWGGLRGAIALAIVLSLPEFDYKDTLVTIVMGAVLFTLVFQGLTIEVLVKFLGLNKLNDADTITKLDGNIQARKKSKDRISNLVAGGYFSERIAENMRTRCDKDLDSLNNEIKYLSQSLSEEETLSILCLRCLARENKMIYDLYSQGLIDESAFRELNYWIGRQIDNVRYRNLLPTPNLSKSFGKVLEEIIISITQKIGFASWSEKSATSRVIRDYTISWGRFRSAQAVIKEFEVIIGEQDTSSEVINNVKNSYLNIIRESQEQINEVASQYPEFIESVQEQLGQRLILITEYEAIGKSASLGLIKEGIASKIRKEHSESLRKLKDNDLSSSLEIEVEELIKKVPMFNGLVDQDRYLLTELLKPRTIPRGRQIIKQGEKGDSLFLIARGIAKVEVEKNEQKTKVASLYAGDFFGEAALLHSEKRNATTTAITPCSLYELMQEDLELLFKKHPKIKDKITETDRQR
jgi:CPA1 family monovalent cation:H+ antiporter